MCLFFLQKKGGGSRKNEFWGVAQLYCAEQKKSTYNFSQRNPPWNKYLPYFLPSLSSKRYLTKLLKPYSTDPQQIHHDLSFCTLNCYWLIHKFTGPKRGFIGTYLKQRNLKKKEIMHSALLPFQEQTNHLIKSRPKLQIQTKSNKNQLQRKSGKALYNVTESLPGDWQVVDTMVILSS